MTARSSSIGIDFSLYDMRDYAHIGEWSAESAIIAYFPIQVSTVRMSIQQAYQHARHVRNLLFLDTKVESAF